MKNIAIDCVLFEKCNLNCSHCFQNHLNNTIDIDYIKNLHKFVYKTMQEEINKKNPDLVMFSMRGGELFLDSINDNIINEYINLILKIKEKFIQDYPTKLLSIHIMSNGIYNNIDRVINLLEIVGGKITLSFDAYGRYINEKQVELFLKNYKKLREKNLIKNIAITLTKESINQYMLNNKLLHYFDDSEIDFNYYIPTHKSSSLPSDDDLFNFFKYLVDNKFYNVIYIRNILENHLNNSKISMSCNCANTTVIFNGTTYHSCNIYVPTLKLTDFYDSDKIDDNNGVKLITEKGLKKRGCLFCPYYNRCSYYCWMMLCYKYYNMNDCPHKKFHQYIINNNSIMENFKEWHQ